jgi:putative FmdB family regulatory protein
MPIYEYHCQQCGREFEKLMGFNDPDAQSPECPACQSRNTQKRISTFASRGAQSSGVSSASSCGSAGGFR